MVFIVINIELPLPKRRRTFAGSIISGALNAALISAAVGLTVYRLSVTPSHHPDVLVYIFVRQLARSG
jgi:hypothetical protein